MAEEYETFREVGFGIGKIETVITAVRDQLSLMQKVFIGAVAVTVASFGYLFITTTQTSILAARMDERLGGLEADVREVKTDVAGIRADIANIKAGMSTVTVDVGGIKKDISEIKALLSKITYVPNKKSSFSPKVAGDWQALYALWQGYNVDWQGFYIDDFNKFAAGMQKHKMAGGGLLISEDPRLIEALGKLGLEPYRELVEDPSKRLPE